MGAGANAGRTLEQRLRPIEDRLEIYNLIDIRPPRAVPCRRLYRLGVDRGWRCSTAVPSSRPTGDRWWVFELQALPGDRAGDPAFRRACGSLNRRPRCWSDLISSPRRSAFQRSPSVGCCVALRDRRAEARTFRASNSSLQGSR